MPENYYKRSACVAASQCDYDGKLSIRAIFDLFMDLASEHALALGVGFYDMTARHCYWLAVRTRVCFYKAANMFDEIMLETWPTEPSAVKCNRCYRITRGDDLIAEGRTEWTVLDTETGHVRRTDSIGYPITEHRQETVCDEKFTRFRNIAKDDISPFGQYTVTSSDIDVGGHMNNVAYIRMLTGLLPVRELRERPVRELEISYRSGCFEGETLTVFRTEEGNEMILQINKPDGTAAAHARIIY